MLHLLTRTLTLAPSLARALALPTNQVVTVLNLLGVDVVAGASNLFALLVIAPFAALFLAGLPEVEP